jgi:hypothetical protein
VVTATRDESHAHATLQKALHLLRSIVETDEWELLIELRAEVDRLTMEAQAGSRVTNLAVCEVSRAARPSKTEVLKGTAQHPL